MIMNWEEYASKHFVRFDGTDQDFNRGGEKSLYI
jgi:hypothetical protein